MEQDRSELNKEKIGEIIEQWKKEVKNVEPGTVAYYVILYMGNKEDDAIAYKTSITRDIGIEFVATLMKLDISNNKSSDTGILFMDSFLFLTVKNY